MTTELAGRPYRRVLIPRGERGEAVEAARADIHVACAVLAGLLKGTDAEGEFAGAYLNLLSLMDTFQCAVILEVKEHKDG